MVVPPQIRQMALRRPVSVSSISSGRSWPAKVNTRSVRGPKPALCICVRFSVRPSENVMVSCSGVYLVQILRIWEETMSGSSKQPGPTASLGIQGGNPRKVPRAPEWTSTPPPPGCECCSSSFSKRPHTSNQGRNLI